MGKNGKYIGELYLLLAAIIYGVGYIVVTFGIQENMGVFFMTGTRFTLATLLYFPMSRKRLLEGGRESAKVGVIVGIIALLGFLAQTLGQAHTTVSNTAFLTGANVIMVPFTSWLIMGTKVSSRSIRATFLSFFGIALLTVNENLSVNYGDLLVLLSAFFFALYSSYLENAVKKHDPRVLVFFQVLTSAIVSLILFLLSGEPIVWSWKIFLIILYLGFFSNILAGLFFAEGIKRTTATRATIIVSLEIVIGSGLGILFFQERFHIGMLLGAMCIIGAILYAENIIGRKKNES